MTHPRVHGSGNREPYRFGEEVENHIRELLNMRYRLCPYFYSSAKQCTETGIPVMRPLALEFEGDPYVSQIADQFMVGDAFMVAPFTEIGGERWVYLPDGEWFDYWSGCRLEGGRRIRVRMGLERYPLYVRGISVVPMGPVVQFSNEFQTSELALQSKFRKRQALSCFNGIMVTRVGKAVPRRV